MTSLYFVRHAQPVHGWEDDRTRPLTEEGVADSGKVAELFRNIKVDYFVSSPYKRSFDTIKESAAEKGMKIHVDERLREREKGFESNNHALFKKRWNDFDYHEECGESINMVQRRNIAAVEKILKCHACQCVVVGTHGTALSSILNYYRPSFDYKDFKRILDYMPYIIRLDFEGTTYIGNEELLIIQKEFQDK